MTKDDDASDHSEEEEDIIVSAEEIAEEEPKSDVERIAELEAALVAAEREVAYKQADVRNAQQRAAKERSEALRYGGMGLARRLIDAMQNLDRALDASGAEDAFVEGVRMVRDSLASALAAEGVRPIETDSVPFDPTSMEAIATVPAPDGVEPGHIVETIEGGWRMHNRILRAARVVVASE